MVDKLTLPATQNEVQLKVNDIIDNTNLGDLKNVTISNPSAGQNLTYDAANQVWKNTSTSATVAWGGITGTLSDQTDLQNALDDKYDASNPNGYTSNVGTVTSVNNVSPVSGNVTLTIPSDTSDLTNGAGFIKSSDLTNYVTTDTTQTISGIKTFSGGIRASGNIDIGDINNYIYQSFLKILYLADGADVSGYKFGIYQWLDQLTVTARTSANGWLRDLWQCNANTGVTNFSEIPTIQGTNAAKITDIPTDLGDLTNNAGYIKGITSSDVTTALGYTPYSSANPNNYTSVIESTVSGWGFTKNTGTVTSVNNVSPVNGNVTLSIPTKISDLTDDTATYPIDKADTLTGLTASITELNYTDGVTSNIQTQLNGKLATNPDGTNNLIDNNNKVNITYLPDVVLGQMLYAGTFVPSTAVATLSTNAKTILGTTSDTITLTNDTTAITGYKANEGNYYIASADGTFASISFLTGDWLLSTGSGWTKVSNTDAVTGVKGNAESTYRTGNVNITADNVLPTQISNSGKFLTTNGSTASWADIPTELPSQTSQSGKFLTTNGSAVSWEDINDIIFVDYGVTTWSELEDAVETGKTLVCREDSGYGYIYYPLLRSDSTSKGLLFCEFQSGLINIHVLYDEEEQGAVWTKSTRYALPSQSGESGKFLTTNGTTASWANLPQELPSQTYQSGKFLTTNGTSASWATVDALPSQTSQSGKFLTTNGTTASWANVPSPNDGTLTIQFNGTTVETFSANASVDKTANIQATQVVWRKYATT